MNKKFDDLAVTQGQLHEMTGRIHAAKALANLGNNVPPDYQDLIWGLSEDVHKLAMKINDILRRLEE